jgi:hypothetical protein
MKLAMVKVHDYIEENNLDNEIKMLATVHDEMVFRVKKRSIHLIPKIADLMKLEEIIDKIEWQVPLKVDAELGRSWDVEYEYDKMEAFLKEIKGIDDVSYIYNKDVNYDQILREYGLYKKKNYMPFKEFLESKGTGLTIDKVCSDVSDFNLYFKEFKKEDKEETKEENKGEEVVEEKQPENKIQEIAPERPVQSDLPIFVNENGESNDVPAMEPKVDETKPINDCGIDFSKINGDLPTKPVDTVQEPVETVEESVVSGSAEPASGFSIMSGDQLELKDISPNAQRKLLRQFYNTEFERLMS